MASSNPVTAQDVQAAKNAYYRHILTTGYNPIISDDTATRLAEIWKTKAENLKDEDGVKEADVILSKEFLKTAQRMYNVAPKLDNVKNWVAAADEYLKKIIESKGGTSQEAKDAQKLKADADKILRLLLNKPKRPAPPVPSKRSPTQQQLRQIQTLAKELDDILNTLGENIKFDRSIDEFKKYFDRNFGKVEKLLAEYKEKIGSSIDPKIAEFQILFGNLKDIYFKKTGEPYETPKSSPIQQRPQQPPPQPPRVQPLSPRRTTSPSIVWLIALMLLL